MENIGMSRRSCLLFFVRIFLCFPTLCRATWWNVTAALPRNGVSFIAKYCFDYDANGIEVGEVSFTLKKAYPSTGHVKVVLLDDEAYSYPDELVRKIPLVSTKAYNLSRLDCDHEELNKVAKVQSTIHLDEIGSTKVENFFHRFITEKLRPRYWFVALVDCSGEPHQLEYELHLENIQQGWWRELSMDHVRIRTLSLFVIAASLMVCLQLKAFFLQSIVNTQHPLRLMLTFVVVTTLCSITFNTVDVLCFARHGVDNWSLYVFGKLFKSMSKFMLFLILLLLSKGCCISHQLEAYHVLTVSIVLAPFFAACLWLEMWCQYDPSRLYTEGWIYQTWVGILLVLLDLLLFAFYVGTLMHTIQQETCGEKQSFYRRWGSMFALSFLALPASLVVAFSISGHVREEFMFIVGNAIHLVLQSLMIIGLWPERSQPVFNIDAMTELQAMTDGYQVFK
eukprot:TRINITY_DN46074_c0_g1_i1.p1 TRINITY_DN46074_c0_g1~~TRINITY_DN46074_c0_g1_i1.p1  ORF type:complete len:451 (+),score=33.08 TRINITY_DN46074_c0_g1_i1:26-1378(+)